MKLLAALIASVIALFGFHQHPTSVVSPEADEQSAAVVVASPNPDPFHPTATTSNSRPDAMIASAQATTTIIKQYITQPVIERVVENQFPVGQVLGASTGSDTQTKLADLQNQITALSNRAPVTTFVPSFSGPAASTPVSTQTFAQAQKIDQLNNVTLNGVSGLTDADIPDSITASNYLSLTGGNVIGTLQKVGTLSLGSRLGEIRVVGNTAYVLETNTPAKLYVVDLSNPAEPTLSTTSTATNAIGCCGVSFDVSDKYAYVFGWSQSWGVFDISNPGSIKEVYSQGHYFGVTSVKTITVSGHYAYVGDFGSGVFRILDVADPTVDPRLVGTLSIGGSVGGTVLRGHNAYVKNDGTNALQVINIIDPTNPILVGTVSTDAAGVDDLDMAHTLQMQDEYAYVTNMTSKTMQVINVSNPTAPTVVGSVSFGGQPYNIFVSGRYAFVGTDDGKLNMIDIATPSSPTITATANLTANAGAKPAGIYAAGRYVYVTDWSGGTLDIFDTGGVEANALLAHSALLGTVQIRDDLDISGRFIARNSIQVGDGGILSNGPLTVSATTTPNVFLSKIGVATTSPWRTLSVTGTVGFDGLTGAVGAGSLCLSARKEVVYNSGSDNCLSSLRSTKHDIDSLAVDATSAVMALQPVSFVYNNDASSTVRYGFIAEDTAAVDAHLATYDQSGNISGVDDRSLIAILVEAVQHLIKQIGYFTERVVTKELVATNATADRGTFKELCVDDVCVTRDQFLKMVQQGGATSDPTTPSTFAPATSNESNSNQSATAADSTSGAATSSPADDTATSSPEQNATTSLPIVTDAPLVAPANDASTGTMTPAETSSI